MEKGGWPMMWEIWMQIGRSDSPECCLSGHLLVPEGEVQSRIEAINKLGGTIWLVRPLDNDDRK
jgi:hypothetical protein